MNKVKCCTLLSDIPKSHRTLAVQMQYDIAASLTKGHSNYILT